MAAGRLAAGQGAALLSASSECRCRPGKAPILREQRCPTAAQRTPQHPPHHPPLPTGRAGGFGCTRHAKLSLRPPTQLICTRRVVTPPPPLSTSCCPRVPPQAAPCWEQSCCSGQSATAALVVPGKQRHACSPQPSSHPTAPTLPAAAPGAAPIVALQFCRAVPHRRPSLSRCTAAIPLHRRVGCAAVNALCVNRRAVFARPLLSAAGMGKRGGGEEGVGAPLCEPLRAPTSG